MKKIVMFTMAVLTVLTTVPDVFATSRIIGEYPSNNFAVKGEIGEQVASFLSDIYNEMEADGGQKTLSVSVIGYADKTGEESKNDRVAADRAFQVASIISAKFPNATVNHWSGGAEANKRQVVVDYEIKKTPIVEMSSRKMGHAEYGWSKLDYSPEDISAKKDATVSSNKKIYWILGFLFWGLIVIVIVIFMKNAKRDQKIVFPNEDQKTVKKIADFLAFEYMGQDYVFLPKMRDGKYVSLKEIPGKDGEFYLFGDKKSLKGSLKSSFKQDPGLIDNLRAVKLLFRRGDPGFEQFKE